MPYGVPYSYIPQTDLDLFKLAMQQQAQQQAASGRSRMPANYDLSLLGQSHGRAGGEGGVQSDIAETLSNMGNWSRAYDRPAAAPPLPPQAAASAAPSAPGEVHGRGLTLDQYDGSAADMARRAYWDKLEGGASQGEAAAATLKARMDAAPLVRMLAGDQRSTVAMAPPQAAQQAKDPYAGPWNVYSVNPTIPEYLAMNDRIRANAQKTQAQAQADEVKAKQPTPAQKALEELTNQKTLYDTANEDDPMKEVYKEGMSEAIRKYGQATGAPDPELVSGVTDAMKSSGLLENIAYGSRADAFEQARIQQLEQLVQRARTPGEKAFFARKLREQAKSPTFMSAIQNSPVLRAMMLQQQ